MNQTASVHFSRIIANTERAPESTNRRHTISYSGNRDHPSRTFYPEKFDQKLPNSKKTPIMSSKTVVIIGAGPAGLTAAYQLLRADKNLHV
ncbi:MAG: hypothetical protein J6W70_02355, partial [Lentisphaeria bacterium]|nr:hypothetical protein [Lentisphaeria bacterium]